MTHQLCHRAPIQVNIKMQAYKSPAPPLTSLLTTLDMEPWEVNLVHTDHLLDVICGEVSDLAEIKANLFTSGALSDAGWASFNNPEALNPLDSIFNETLAAAGISSTRSMTALKSHHQGAIVPGFPNGTKPDATIHLTNSTLPGDRAVNTIDHADVYMYIQYKGLDSDVNLQDNIDKLLCSVLYRFDSDPCCRFVCGMTVENATVRLWRFSRVAVLVSEPFSINKHVDNVIRIFVSAARTTTRSRLGFDPSIRCIGMGDVTSGSPSERKYEITVHDNKGQPPEVVTLEPTTTQTYTTIRQITSSTRAGTRPCVTWVFEGLGGDNHAILVKDTWVQQDQELEGSILEKVRGYLKTESSEHLKYFLDPLCHGVVMIDGLEDVTPSLLGETSTVSPSSPSRATLSPVPISRGKESGTQSLVTVISLQIATPITIGSDGVHHKHYRIAFKGKAGRALHELRSYQEAFTALLDGVKALYALYKAGYVHRHLSSENIVLTTEGQQDAGVLIGLNYAQRYPDLNKYCNDMRTGTQFRAAEVEAQDFLFAPTENDLFDWCSETPPLEPMTMSTWSHNPIHDVESAWWIALWVFYHLGDKEEGTPLFMDKGQRKLVLTSPEAFKNLCAELPHNVLSNLNEWLLFIRLQYKALEEMLLTQTESDFDHAYVFETVCAFIEGIARVVPPSPGASL